MACSANFTRTLLNPDRRKRLSRWRPRKWLNIGSTTAIARHRGGARLARCGDARRLGDRRL